MAENTTIMTKIVVTGCAGFIASHLCEKLLALNYQVIGIDNFDPYYDRKIKESNLNEFINHPNMTFYEMDLKAKGAKTLFKGASVVIHLAGKAGVRPSIEDPQKYIDDNITATLSVLDAMVEHNIKKLLFASSSSIYGNNPNTPWSESLSVDNPISPYAFTKKACELLNHSYHHLYKLDILNLRFFTVYGPRQRPDLAIHKFIKLIASGKEIPMFGDGSTSRDYTFVLDTVDGILGALKYITQNENIYDIVNLGNNTPVPLHYLIKKIGEALNILPKTKQMPMQPGDVDTTFADISKAQELFNYQPKTTLEEGLKQFVNWHNRIVGK